MCARCCRGHKGASHGRAVSTASRTHSGAQVASQVGDECLLACGRYLWACVGRSITSAAICSWWQSSFVEVFDNMESYGLANAKLVAKPHKFNGEQVDLANWKCEMMNWLQVVGVLLPDEVQEAIGCPKRVALDPTAKKGKIAKGKQLYAMTVGVVKAVGCGLRAGSCVERG